MTRRLRTFLLCLLIAALPLQGLAAVLKASCGPAHHKQVVELAQVDHASADVHGAHHGHAFGTLDFHDPGLLDGTADAGATTSATSATSAYCSACAVCSASALALPSSVMPRCAEPAPSLALSAPAPLLASVVPAGLERPPRTISL